MNIYHYHPTTREFIGEGVAEDNPMRPGEYLVPAHATAEKPVVPDGKVAVFNGLWVYLPDYRGKVVYATETGIPATIGTIGDIPSTFTEIAPPGPNYVWHEDAWVVDLIATANAVRAHRNQLLLESDWTQLPDAGGNRYLWTQYRQALRDIPEQNGFPESVTYPTKP